MASHSVALDLRLRDRDTKIEVSFGTGYFIDHVSASIFDPQRRGLHFHHSHSHIRHNAWTGRLLSRGGTAEPICSRTHDAAVYGVGNVDTHWAIKR